MAAANLDLGQPRYGNYIQYDNLQRNVVEIRHKEATAGKPMILIIGDSKIDLLHGELKELVTAPYIINYAYGLRTSELTPILKSKLRNEAINFVVIMTGTCDITSMTNRLLSFESDQGEIQKIMDNLLEVYNVTTQNVTLLQPQTKTIAGITGIELHTYNDKPEEDKNQSLLNDAVWIINARINKFNNDGGVPNLRVDNLIHKNLTKNKKRSRTHAYDRYTDGCHPDENLFKAMAKYVGKLFGELQSRYLLEQQE